MAERSSPWWRKAIHFALDGIRTGFGLFSRTPKQASVDASEPQPKPVATLKEDKELIPLSPEVESIAVESVSSKPAAIESAAEMNDPPHDAALISHAITTAEVFAIPVPIPEPSDASDSASAVEVEQPSEPSLATAEVAVHEEPLAEPAAQQHPETQEAGRPVAIEKVAEPLVQTNTEEPASFSEPEFKPEKAKASNEERSQAVPEIETAVAQEPLEEPQHIEPEPFAAESGPVPEPVPEPAVHVHQDAPEHPSQPVAYHHEPAVEPDEARAPVREPEPTPEPPVTEPEPEEEPRPNPDPEPKPLRDPEPQPDQSTSPVQAEETHAPVEEPAEEAPDEPAVAPAPEPEPVVIEEVEPHPPEPTPVESAPAEIPVPAQAASLVESEEPVVREPQAEPAEEPEPPRPELIEEQDVSPEPVQLAEIDQESAAPEVEQAPQMEMNEPNPEQAAPEQAPEQEIGQPVDAQSTTPAEESATTSEPAPSASNNADDAADEAGPTITASAPPPKAPIKLESRDNEADLSPFSVIVAQVYDGPLDLLLDLIRKQDIDIYDIPIARITAQFLAYVNQLKASDVDVAGEFIYTASLLIHIKSKMLLPRAPSGPDDQPEDPRRELVERLLEHERFKNAAQMLQQKQLLEAATWTNPGMHEFRDDAAAEPEIAADTVDLVRIFRDILERARNRPIINVQEDSVTVGQMIQFLARRLTMEDKPVALRRLLSHTRSERALIAMFLALLELVRMQAILLRQDKAFSEIFIKKHSGFENLMNEGLAVARDDWQ